ncbi:peptide-methionine (S)-S-oxide reductase/peptide methionine sulfoxide reductase msrA/msrB [Alteribacillus persepolensis]|uniref:Peptide methionine sulfoxide reductase MsrA n=1 Tax=Alteribacillus persepolensis TaxID=568899 RepID=A0A1G8C9Y0_9BACI|nr:peptide-methionine (S)-S-oxide reductase MsrA [Alteribacillus persepolensis]SDH42337.1 peptide-methionine (S)-S-oxide reductase/peptide methionine sulfoxide reductase msrA/msrB [Alteribacillus persepolensis]
MSEQTKLATFAGGCFWCMVGPFEQLDGVLSITSGYTGGETENPTYEEVCSNTTGHVEAVQIVYNPEKVTYEELLDTFWRQIDPTDSGGQFNDRGESYQTAVFYHDNEQKQIAEQSKEELNQHGPFDNPVVTPVVPAKTFYPAEDYHQDYHKKNRFHYLLYRKGSGREGFIQQYWGDN